MEKRRYVYHLNRDMNPARYNLRYGGTKHSYSMGYTDACENRPNNRRTIKNHYGSASASSYSLGYARGQKMKKNGIDTKNNKRW
ncbi:MAG: hypothetical protein IJ039_04530 [Clostridia bacterium]|nr:hypothetical protein [Clostridia bacterium]